MLMEFLHEGKTSKIIQAYFKVYSTLGYGFLEKVFENAMLIELRRMGFDCKSQQPVKVFYDNYIVGDYFSDIIVDNCIILEIKTREVLRDDDLLQLINYLRATSIEVGLLLNFGKKPGFSRKIFTNDRKKRNSDPEDAADGH